MSSQKLERISDNIYLFRDICNVYLIKDGDRGLLIDSGSASILPFLGEVGVDQLEWVLHTHHHRDQCQGDRTLNKRGVKIAVPAEDSTLFTEVDNFWKNRDLFDNYDTHSDYMTLAESIECERELEDHETFQWGPYSFYIHPTPGHTKYSTTFITEIDGKKIAFTGDLIHSPGKVWNLYDLEWSYSNNSALNAELFSLQSLKSLSPDMILPSHGDPIDNPIEAIDATYENLMAIFKLAYETTPLMQKMIPSSEATITQFSPHLLGNISAVSNFYCLLSDSGKGLFIDYGWPSGAHFTSFKFVEHSIDILKERYGLKSIEVVIPSHYHDDHIGGIPYLQKNYGSKVWVYENMKYILENPMALNLNCTLSVPISVDRAFKDGEKVKWEEYELTFHYFPGQTEYATGVSFIVDGKKAMVVGDNIYIFKEGWRGSLICRNYVRVDTFIDCASKLKEVAPDILITGHWGIEEVTPQKIEAFWEWAQRWRQSLIAVAVQEDPDFGLDPGWVSIKPYYLEAKAGDSLRVEAIINNHGSSAIEGEIALNVPRDWKVNPESGRYNVEAKEIGSLPFEISISPRAESGTRKILTLEVGLKGQELGQITEAVVDIR